MPETSPAAPPASSRTRLLLVDDSAEGRRALARLLELYGYDVTAVGDGTSALAHLSRTPPPEVIVTDLMLPDVDGREIARQAKLTVPSAIVAVITGWDFGAEAPDPKLTGIDRLFLKPVNAADLVSWLRSSSASSKLRPHPNASKPE